LELGRGKKCPWPFLDLLSSMLESSKKSKCKTKFAFDLQLLAPKVGGQAKNIFAWPLLKLLSFMLESSMRGQTNVFLLGLQFSMSKVGARAKIFASTPPRPLGNGTLEAPKHGVWEHEERPRQKNIQPFWSF